MATPFRTKPTAWNWPGTGSVLLWNLIVRAYGGSVHIEPVRDNVVSMTLTLIELGALVAGARMALDALRAAPPGSVPNDAITTLERVLADYDRVRERMRS